MLPGPGGEAKAGEKEIRRRCGPYAQLGDGGPGDPRWASLSAVFCYSACGCVLAVLHISTGLC